MNLRHGTLLKHGEYRIERELGHGGFGITYLATQVGLNRKVAIKEFFMSEYCERDADTSQVSLGTSGSRETVERFRNKFIKEAQNIAGLKHPHIISIYDVFEDNGTAYYVMEYLEYGSLADLVKRQGRLSEADALRYTRQIADALRYIHARKMNHLDVKPGNILIDETDNAVLIDFGLSKRYDDEGNQTSTTPVGISHGYAPLEQYKKSGVGTFSPATDIYSLGATLYKLVTGTTPPDANDVSEDGLPALPSYVSSTIAAAIEQAMQPRRKDRPQTVEAFLALLDAEIDVKDAKDDEVTVIEPRQEKEPDVVAKQQNASTTEDKGSILLGCIVILLGLAAICGLGYWGVKSFKAHRAEKVHMAYVEQQRQDSIVREAARLEQIEQHRKDSLEAVAAAERAAAEEAERKRVEEVERKRVEEAKRKEEIRSMLPTGTINGHEYVDLGLSVKWATCNLGASSPSDYGNYYAWGETSTKSDYRQSTYKYFENGSYVDIGSNISGTSYDVAHVKWGGSWRMPTLNEIKELNNKCSWEWTEVKGIKGQKVTGPNGNSIFLPAAGYRGGTEVGNRGSYGHYWSGTLYEGYSSRACNLYFNSGDHDWGNYRRGYGLAVRPVSE